MSENEFEFSVDITLQGIERQKVMAAHKAAIAQAVKNARKGQYHDDLVVIDDFARDTKKINIASESLQTTSIIRDKMVRAWDAAILEAENAN